MPLLLFLTPAVGLAMIARIEEQKWRQRGGRQPRKLPNLRAMPRNKKVDSGTRTQHWPSLRGALATKQSRGRVMTPLIGVAKALDPPSLRTVQDVFAHTAVQSMVS